MKKSKNVIIYHNNCNDGFCSLCIAMEQLNDKNATLIPADYKKEETIIFNPELVDKDILILDFGFEPELIEILLKNNNKVTMIDHHKTMLEYYSKYLKNENDNFISVNKHNFNLLIDMNRSGALMTWDFFHQKNAPQMVQYISDGDLYRFLYSNTEKFLAKLNSVPKDLKTWTELLNSPEKVSKYTEEGEVLLNQFNNFCLEFAKNKTPIKIKIQEEEFFGDAVLCAGDNNIRSKVGEIIYNQNNTFAAIIYKMDQENIWISLRSSNKNKNPYNVKKIAEYFNGGGHDTAAGLIISKETFNKHFEFNSLLPQTIKPIKPF
jgi:nanoRNase/pAp phosphatase (c-di-AMP/oligoRNAs hydrolase)